LEPFINTQREDVKKAKQSLSLKADLNYGVNIQELCEHRIIDTFGDDVKGIQEHHCLVCDKRWSEKGSL
jgi:hypothetical protein